MELRDIVNRDIVNLQNCESEPIHIPGSIQPQGFLLFLEKENFRVSYCSANITEYCGVAPAAVLGKPFVESFGAESAGALATYLASPDFTSGNPANLHIGLDRYSCAIRAQENGYLINAEPFPDGYLNPPDLYEQTRRFVSRMESSQSMQELCQFVAEETRQLTGYDRVMIYRFDKDYNGEVFAEAAAENLEPFAGLHYPHTDIPPQARQLYLSNLMRIITDVDYEPVPIMTLDDGNDKTLDLSYAVLRSVSPIHIAYLKNMGVAATLTISLVHNKKLWGLIACHHYSPKNIPHFTRLTAQLQGHFLASQIALRQSAAEFTASQQIAEQLEKVMHHAGQLDAADVRQLLTPAILGMTHATGMALAFQGQTWLYGDTPDETSIIHLSREAQHLARNGFFSTDSLPSVLQIPAEDMVLSAGLLYHDLGGEGANFILWLRKENRQLKNWAGDPAKAIIRDDKGLSPRKSFEQWQEIVSGQSAPWTESEQQAAATLAHSLQKQLNFLLLQAEEKRNRTQSEQLRQAYTELEGINWISMHDLQEPLRKIQVFASRLEARSMSENECLASADDAHRIFANAMRMQHLIKDMQSFSRLNATEMTLEPTDLEELVAAIAADFSEELHAQNATLEHSGLPQIKGNPFLVRQLLGNLIGNALKFSDPDRPLHIQLSHLHKGLQLPDALTVQPENYEVIAIRDNGIGFDMTHGHDIFGLFKRLHSREEYEGTGVGLAICRKIMQLHNGFITASGKAGEGAEFQLWFPKH